MAEVAIQSYIGRDYSVAFVAGNDPANVKTVMLKTGLNMLSGELWDIIKKNPLVKRLLDTPHDFCVQRIKQTDGGADNRYTTIRKTFNVDSKEHKMLEVRDFRAVETAPQSKKKD